MYSRRDKYYDSASEEEGLEVPTFKDGRTTKATHLSARFKQIEEHDKDDYCPSDESYDSEEELDSLSDSEKQLKLASPITPFAKKHSKTSKLLARKEESDSETQEDLSVAESPIRKKSAKRPVSISSNQPAFKPINPKKAATDVQPTPHKPKAVDAKTKALPTKPIVLKSLELDGAAPVRKPASKTPAQVPASPPSFAPSAESDQEEIYVEPKTKKAKLNKAAEEDSLIQKMESLSIMKMQQKQAELPKPKKPSKHVALDEGDESDEESIGETLKLKKSKKAGKENDSKKVNKEGKKKKDPNAPKKPSTGYREFYVVRFPELKADNPDMGVADLAKEIGAEWKQLDSDEKAVYEKKAKRDQKRYQAEMAAYNTRLVSQQ